jgi:hypothetical protein
MVSKIFKYELIYFFLRPLEVQQKRQIRKPPAHGGSGPVAISLAG